MEVRSNGRKVRSNGMKVRSNGRKVRSNGMKVRSNGRKVRSNGMQGAIRLHFCPECLSIEEFHEIFKRSTKEDDNASVQLIEMISMLMKFLSKRHDYM